MPGGSETLMMITGAPNVKVGEILVLNVKDQVDDNPSISVREVSFELDV